MEFSKNISKALHLGRGSEMNIYTIGNKCNIFRSTAEKKETWSYDRFQTQWINIMVLLQKNASLTLEMHSELDCV